MLLRQPRTPEIDFSGVIAENSLILNGPYKIGDEVYGHIPPVNHVTSNIGALAEKAAVSPAWILPKPADFKHEQAASLPTSFVSAYKLAKQVDTGARVFVNGGSGGVGLILLQLLKKWKKAHVTTTASSQSWEVVKQQQPDAIVNYREVRDLSRYLQEAHQPFDFIIDLIGDKILLQRCRNFLVPNGTFVAFGGGLSSATIRGFLGWLASTLLYGLWPRWAGESVTVFRYILMAFNQASQEEVDEVSALSRYIENTIP